MLTADTSKGRKAKSKSPTVIDYTSHGSKGM